MELRSHRPVAVAVVLLTPFGGDDEAAVVELDPERKAAMVSNLLVVLCAESDVQPVVNTGTLYG